MYGWRGRIGLLVPASGTTMEAEAWRVMPEGVSVHVQRLPYKVSVEGAAAMLEKLEEAAKLLATAELSIIAFGSIGASSLKGRGWDQELIRIIERATNVRATTAATAVVKGFERLGVKTIGIASGWIEEFDLRLQRFLEENGFRVIRCKCLGLDDNVFINKQPPSFAYNLVRDADRPDVEAILIPGGGVRTIDILDKAETDLGKPVVSSNQALFWDALRSIGVREPVRGFGSLLTL